MKFGVWCLNRIKGSTATAWSHYLVNLLHWDNRDEEEKVYQIISSNQLVLISYRSVNTEIKYYAIVMIDHNIYSCEVFERYYKSKIPLSLRESPLNDNDWLMVCQHGTMRQQKCQQYLINNISYIDFRLKKKGFFIPFFWKGRVEDVGFELVFRKIVAWYVVDSRSANNISSITSHT